MFDFLFGRPPEPLPIDRIVRLAKGMMHKTAFLTAQGFYRVLYDHIKPHLGHELKAVRDGEDVVVMCRVCEEIIMRGKQEWDGE